MIDWIIRISILVDLKSPDLDYNFAYVANLDDNRDRYCNCFRYFDGMSFLKERKAG